jgi:hypothetical protein
VAVAAAVAKGGPALAAVPLVTVPLFDPAWAVIIPVGLTAAALARLATVIDDAQPWRRIKADLFKSLLIAGGNAITASIIIRALHLDYLTGLGVAFACGFGGVEALRGFWNRSAAAFKWLRGHVIEDAKVEELMGRRRQEGAKQIAALVEALKAAGVTTAREEGKDDE